MSDKITSATWRQCNETSSWIPGGVWGLIFFSSLSTTYKVMSDKFLLEILGSYCLEYHAQKESAMMGAEDLFNYFALYFSSFFSLHFCLLYFVYLLCQVKVHLSYLGFSLKVMQEVFRTAKTRTFLCYHSQKWLNYFLQKLQNESALSRHLAWESAEKTIEV